MKKIFILLILLMGCIKQKNFKILPLALIGSKAETTPYTLESIGITNTAGQANENSSNLPLISDRERDAIKRSFEELDKMGMMTKEKWQSSSQNAMKAMSEIPSTDAELDRDLDNLLKDGTPIPERPIESKEEVIRRETEAADRFYEAIRVKLSEYSKEELVQLRINFTLTLVMIRMQKDFNDPVNGIPDEILEMGKEKAVKIRQDINAEFLRRGITNI